MGAKIYNTTLPRLNVGHPGLLFLEFHHLVLLGASLLPLALVLQSTGTFESMADELNGKGFRASTSAMIAGASGVKHDFAFEGADRTRSCPLNIRPDPSSSGGGTVR